MEPVRLWRDAVGEFVRPCSCDADPEQGPHDEYGSTVTEYAALPRADFDALVKRAEEAERGRDVAVREQEAWRLAYVRQARQQEAATAPADAGNVERASARLLPTTLDGVTLIRGDTLQRTIIASPDIYEAFRAAFSAERAAAKGGA